MCIPQVRKQVYIVRVVMKVFMLSFFGGIIRYGICTDLQKVEVPVIFVVWKILVLETERNNTKTYQ